MSGDVQPRKRREKKKKKDDGEESTSHQPPRMPSIPSFETDEVNIHVHNESTTGGGICAKLVFFVLLTTLAILIGLIITEHRGLTDLDTIQKESKFSQLFEGWIDTSPDDHDDHDEHLELEEDDDHDEEDHDEHDEEDEDDHDEHDEDEDEGHDEEEEEEEVEESEQNVSEIEEAEEEEDDDEDAEADSQAYEEDEEPEDEEEEVEPDSNQATAEDDDEEDEVKNESEQDDDDDQPVSEADQDDDTPSNEDTPSKEDNDAEEIDDKDDGDDDDEDDQEVSEEITQKATVPSMTKAKIVEDEEDNADDNEDQEDNDDNKEVIDDGEDTNEETGEQLEENEDKSIGVVKGAVGIAILVVAYVVLVKKWKSEKGDSSVNVPSDLSRRNTIIVPPRVEEVKQVIKQHADELTDEEIEEEKLIFQPKIKQEYQSLRHTYERSLTPESDIGARDEYDDEEEEEGEEIEDEPEEIEYEEGDYEEEEEGEEEEGEGAIPADEEVISDEELEEEEEEEVDEEEILSEDDDEELMKKLEAKYGKLSGGEEYKEEETFNEDYEDNFDCEDSDASDEAQLEDTQDTWKHLNASGPQSFEELDQTTKYDLSNITNEDDFMIVDELDEALEHININAALALTKFNAILKKFPKSPRALHGKAQCLDNLAELKQSNNLLNEAIASYLELVNWPKTPDALLVQAAKRCIDRLHFLGQYGRALPVHKVLINRFPNEVKYKQQLTVTYLTINRIEDARNTLKDILQQWPNDGFALVHYGFILKVNDGDMKKAINYLHKGIATREEGVIDGRFYFHLGDALTRLGRSAEAYEVYLDGVTNKVFQSVYQRSLYNVKNLKAMPYWHKKQMPRAYQEFFQRLEANYKQIASEGTSLINRKGYFQDESENLRDSGDWKQFELFARGVKNKANCNKCPITCNIVETLTDAVGCRRGQIKFSIMHPGTHVWPHCGPTNCRLRAHLGLKVPEKTFIRVAKEIRSWNEGEIMIFDDSFEHEVWHNGTSYRLILIVDVWHPDLTAMEKRSLSAI